MGTSCKGHTLPLALAGILVAVAMLRSFHDRATSLVQSWRHARAGAALENDVLASAADAAPSPGRCTPLAVQALHGYAERVVCHEPLPVLSSFPNVALPTLRLDFDSIFSRAAPCAGELRATPLRTFTTPVARLTCLLADTIPSSTVAQENILAGSLGVAEPAAGATALLATPGTLEVRGAITLSADTLIVSGGDASIGALVAQKEVVVTVLSAKGSVAVQQLGGPVSLVLIGAKTLRAPASPLPATFPLPPVRPPAILAVVAPDGSGK